MATNKKSGFFTKEEDLHLGRAFVAIFALLIAASHLAYNSSSGFSAPVHISNTSGTGYPSAAQMMSFNYLSFWFDVEIIAYTLIAVVFLLGLRTWYPIAIAFNALNVILYFLSGVIAIPGLTNGAFGSHLNLSLALSVGNILAFAWILELILGLMLLKYDPGSELDRLLVTKRSK